MRRKQGSVVFVLLPLILTVLLVGCGGGSSEQSGGGGQEKKQEGRAAGKAAKKEPLERKMAFGIVRAFKDDKRRLSLRPTANAQGKKPLGFKVRKNAQITLGGKKAELGDIKEDQQAQISYVVKNEVNRAVVVHLFDANEKPAGGDEKKGNSSEGGEKSG
jgi:hypothetical protein